MVKKKTARIIPTEPIPKQVWSKRGRPAKPGMPATERPSITLYIGWDIWFMLETLCQKWDCGPSESVQRLLTPFIGEVREAKVSGEKSLLIDEKYSLDSGDWVGWRTP